MVDTKKMKTFNTTSEAYMQALRDVLVEPDYICAPRGQQIREILNYSFKVLNPTQDPVETFYFERNGTIALYTQKEKDLYDSCSTKVEDFAKASKFWNQLANPDGTVNSAYGYLIFQDQSEGNAEFEFEEMPCSYMIDDYEVEDSYLLPHIRTPWEWCVDSLKKDKDTRQAIMRFNKPTHLWMGNKDVVCTLTGTWHIRNDQLHLSMVMRSNDLMRGLVYDISWFCSLMDKMLDELKETYPTLTKGHYYHTSQSMHLYERDIPTIMKMLGE